MVIKTACIIMKECAKCCLDGAVYHITEVNPKKKKSMNWILQICDCTARENASINN